MMVFTYTRMAKKIFCGYYFGREARFLGGEAPCPPSR